MSKKNWRFSMEGKGYYIALILCAAAIGITGYLYYRNNQTNLGETPEPQISATEPQKGGDVPTIITTPGGDSTTAEPTSPAPSTQKQKPGNITSPLSGETIMEHSMEMLCYNPTTRDWRVHDGIDIAAEAGTDVRAAADGTVYTIYDDEALGKTIVIRHDGGYVTKYASLGAEVSVTVGDTIQGGQVIGTVGNTALMETAIGDHIHFSVSCNGDIVDPNDFLKMG